MAQREGWEWMAMTTSSFERTCGARTESFHLGSTSCTIDLAREVTGAEIAAAELTTVLHCFGLVG